MAALAAPAGLTDVLGEPRIPRAQRRVVARRRKCRRRPDRTLQLVDPLHRRHLGGGARRPGAVADRGLHTGVHRLEGLGDGLPRARRRCR